MVLTPTMVYTDPKLLLFSVGELTVLKNPLISESLGAAHSEFMLSEFMLRFGHTPWIGAACAEQVGGGNVEKCITDAQKCPKGRPTSKMKLH